MTMEQIDAENRMKALESRANALYAKVFNTDVAQGDTTKTPSARMDVVEKTLDKVESKLAGDQPDISAPIEGQVGTEPENPAEEPATESPEPGKEEVIY